jgi:hypothetical protein
MSSPPVQMQDPAQGAARGSRSLVERISPSNLLLLKTSLLDGDAAIAAYRAWRPSLDFETISPGQQRLIPLLQNNLTRLGIDDPLLDKFRGIRLYFWVQNLKAMAFAQRVFAELDQIGVPFVVLKGAALIACYLDDRSLRPMSDIDILVPEDRLADTIPVLTAMNLHPQQTSPRYLMLSSSLRSSVPGWGFVGTDQGMNIDVHWKALHLDRRPEADDRFWQAHRKTSLDGVPIRVLDPADQLIHICAHAAQPTANTAAEQWPADAVLVMRGSTDLCFERLVSEAAERGLSAIMAEALDFLAQEFNISIPNVAISRMRAAASWTERTEMRLLADPSKGATRINRYLLALLDFRRGHPGGVSRSIAHVLPPYLKSRAGVGRITPAFIVALQAVLRWPGWLRRTLGRDRYRILPDTDRLPKVSDTLKLDGPEFEEAPFVAGWGLPESTGRWTRASEATVAWCVRGQDQDLTLRIDGTPTLDEKAPLQRVDLWGNDRPLASWRFQRDTVSPLPARIRVPRGLIRNRDVLFVTFLVRRRARPVDPRGFFLRSLTLEAEQK